MKEIQSKVNERFLEAFGRTPLRQRLDDIFNEAIELRNATDVMNLKEEAGDLLASTIMLCNECEWDAEDLIKRTLDKIKLREQQYKSLGRKTKVALLGGAFDPPTIGHIELAKFVLDTSGVFDEVWLVPCYQHMFGKNMTDPKHRLEMCEIATRSDGRLKTFDYEIRKKMKGETYHFCKTLLSEDFAKHEYDFSIIMGQDNANSFDKWVNYQDLEKMMRFVVVSRGGVEVDQSVNWYYKPPHIYLHSVGQVPQTSSTEVREWLQRGPAHTCSMLDSEVADYIYENGLY
jgi:nicotinate-nucleotide adenylyltransferase